VHIATDTTADAIPQKWFFSDIWVPADLNAGGHSAVWLLPVRASMGDWILIPLWRCC